MNHNVSTNHLTMLARITNRLVAIKELPIAQLELRQPMLVDLLASIVDHITVNGTETSPHRFIKAQDFWPMLSEMSDDAGFKFLGAGYFSAAFSHEMLPGKVIKIGFKKEDSGAAYAAYCRANAHTVGLPLIHALKRHTSCYSVVLNEYSEFTQHVPRNATQDERQALEHRIKAYKIVRGIINNGDHEVLNVPSALAELPEWHRSLVETAKGIREFFLGLGSFDIHSGNVMIDKYGRLVITDPVSYTDDRLQEVEFDSICDEISRLRLIVEADQKAHLEALEADRLKRLPKQVQGMDLGKAERMLKEFDELFCTDGRIKPKVWPANVVHVIDGACAGMELFAHKVKAERADKIQPRFIKVRSTGHLKHWAPFLQTTAERNEQAARRREDLKWTIAAGLPLRVDVELDRRFIG